MEQLLAIAAGGGLGAVGRYLVSSAVGAHIVSDFPFGTLTANVLGSFVMGVLVETMTHLWAPGQVLRAFLTVGVLGGFTTFSSFSLESIMLIEGGQSLLAAGYVLASVVLSLTALISGLLVTRFMIL